MDHVGIEFHDRLHNRMAAGPPSPNTSAPAAMRLLVPREHGSWGLWLLPLLSAGIVGWSMRADHPWQALFYYFLIAASGFLIHQPLAAVLGRSALKTRTVGEKRVALFGILVFSMIGVAGLAGIALQNRPLILGLVVSAAACMAAGLAMARSRAMRALAQITGALGLTSTAAGAYYAITGRLDGTAGLLWMASWLFAAAQIEYVQLRLRTASSRDRSERLRAGWKVFALHLALPIAAIAASLLLGTTWLLSVAFLPALLRLAVWSFSAPSPIRVHRLGMTELLQHIVFASLLVTALLLR